MYCRLASLFALALIAFVSLPAQALIIEDDMSVGWNAPFGTTNVYPWTRVRFTETGMASDGSVLTMSTSAFRGTWFGNGTLIGQQPGWLFGSNTDGTYISIDVKLSPTAADWSLYFYDASGYAAAWLFNPAGNYSMPTRPGVEFTYATAGNVGVAGYVDMDLSDDFHRFEVLLKGGMVSYAIDGMLVHTGAAFHTNSQQLLVIGDGSGSSPTGVGAMQVDHILIDTAPTFSALTTISTVPVPAGLPLLASALVAGGLWRRRGS